MLHPPLSVVLAWPIPNYKNPITRGPARVVLAAVLIPLLLIAVLARFYTRLRITRNYGPDDTLIAIGLVCKHHFLLKPAVALSIAHCSLVSCSCVKRASHLPDICEYSTVHIWDIPLSAGLIASRLLLLVEILYAIASSLVKFSIVVFYRRLLNRVQNI